MLNTTKEVIFHVLPYVKGRVLDLGAGMAKYKEIIVKNAGNYVACDVKKTENIDTVCNVANLIFPSESFDTVISTQVFEHVDNPFTVVREIKKVLKSGGNAIITAPFMVPFHPDPKDNFRFSKEGLEEIFKSQSFEIVESGIYGGFFMILSEMIHFSWFNPYARKPSRFFAFMEKMAKFLDKIFPYKIIYTNTFVVAKKK
ncbi:MAG: class I SAM-dependent methyltransferase [Candidatus Azambacteria bacterium]|nr:class I SAM-dependent methyltransferase [Candidatus Azambacteria bacterium]